MKKKKELRPVWSVMLDMGIAYYMSGNDRVQYVAKKNIKRVNRSSRAILIAVSESPLAGEIVIKAIKDVEDDPKNYREAS